MTVINIQVTGDHWVNREEFIENLKNANPNGTIILNSNSEAPCLKSIGVREIVDTWLEQHRRAPETIFITNWFNSAEQIPYKKMHPNDFSHFFKYSQLYWPSDIKTVDSHAKLFGLFLGRSTISRNAILYYVANNLSDHFLLSRMKNVNRNPWPHYRDGAVNLEILDEWIEPENQSKVFEWMSQCPVTSIDNKSVRDQFTIVEQSAAECNRSLLTYYDQFNIELVCESYTIGDTFFPTEKTVRPMSAGKPILVYGPKNFLSRLAQLGFKTYSCCWNEDYDQLEGPARWSALKTIIHNLVSLPKTELLEILSQAQTIAIFNRQHLEKLTK